MPESLFRYHCTDCLKRIVSYKDMVQQIRTGRCIDCELGVDALMKDEQIPPELIPEFAAYEL